MIFGLFNFYLFFYSHDIADRHDLVTYSFGIDGIDRHSIVYKKEFKPTDDELETLRMGDSGSYDRKLQELKEKMASGISFVLLKKI